MLQQSGRVLEKGLKREEDNLQSLKDSSRLEDLVEFESSSDESK